MAHAADHRLVPDCRVSVGGKPLKLDEDAALTRVDVDLDVDLFGQCVLTFHDPHLKLINGLLFASGVLVKLEIGFHTKMKKVFEGEVVALEPQFRRDLPPTLKVVCLESLHRLAMRQMTRAFNSVDDKQIVTKIAQEHGLTGVAPAGTKEHILQSNVTDAVFLRRLAQKHGNHLRISGKKLIIGPPPQGGQLTITPGDGVGKIRVRISANSQVSEVSVHGWDPKSKREIAASAKGTGAIGEGARKHGGGAKLSLAGLDHAPSDVATAEKMAKGRMRKLAEGFVRAEVEMIGNPELIPGHQVNLDKLGAEIDGTYRIEHARHQFSKHGYYLWLKMVRIAKKKAAKVAAKKAQHQKPPSRNWIEIELVDQQGAPVAGATYVVKGPDGKEVLGTLDDKGKARLEGLDRGNCVVKFPGHNDSWRPA